MSPLPLLSGLAAGMVFMHVFDRYSERIWSTPEVLVIGLLGGLGLAAEIVCLTWNLAQRGHREFVTKDLELPRRNDPALLPKLPEPHIIPATPERTSREEPGTPAAVPKPLAAPAPPAPAPAPAISREDAGEPWMAPRQELPSLALPETPMPAELASQVESLTALWNRYLAEGNGLFSVRGLQRQLDKETLAGEVLSGESLGLSDSVAAVDLKDEWGRLYLVPSFTRSTLAVADWFDAPFSNARTALVKRLLRPAILSQTAEGWQCIRRGAIE